MAIKLRLKHSSTAGKAPLPTDLVEGELALNINDTSPAAYIKDSAGAVVKLAGLGSVSTVDATEIAKGIVELATAVETTTGTDDTRAVHPAGLKVELDKKVKLAGDTMTGNLNVPSLNGGQLAGLRNVLINGDLVINQRGVTIAAAAPGAYGPDRWKKVDAGNMTQIVEAGNFEPGATYTLSGAGVTVQHLTAPATGNWTLPNIPIAATKIQLELGTVATPFERRPIGTELALCQRYFQAGFSYGFGYGNAGAQRVSHCSFAVTMRAIPSIAFTSGSGSNSFGQVAEAVHVNGFGITTTTSSVLGAYVLNNDWTASAEF